MDPEKWPELTVVYAATALRQLDEIWNWNQQHHGADHADQYIEFLKRHIDVLKAKHRLGQKVDSRPELRYILVRRSSRGHGHVVVYSADDSQVNVLYVFHSAQDWQAKLADEFTA